MTNDLTQQDLNHYVIDNVKLWSGEGGAAVTVRDGRLVSFDDRGLRDGATRVDGRGMALLPAGVDAQVHLRVPGQAQKETPETGLLAALKGGYAAVLTMPNTKPTIDGVDVLARGRAEVAEVENRFGVHVYWSAAITKGLNSSERTDFRALVAAGVRAFTNDGLGVESDEVMDRSFADLESLDVPLLQHAEFAGHGGCLAPGPMQREVGATPYADDPEWKMVERDIDVLRRHPKARYHVLHVSSAKTVALVRAAKREGLRVSCEVTPHHLFFNTETMDSKNPSFKMNPPIRGPVDQEALWEGLRDGTIDFVATDHAPHEAVMKSGGFDQMAFGTLGMETTMHVLLDGLKHGRISRERLIEVWARAPGRFLNLPAGLGDFAVDAPFHGALVDVDRPPHVYAESEISSLSKNSCFTGTALPGRVTGAFHGPRVFDFH